MKLNLLPTYVSQASRVRTAWVLMALISVVSVAASVLMILYSTQQRDTAKREAEELVPRVDEVRNIAKMADTVMADSVILVSNSQLAKTMNEANAKYPRFYRKVMPYIPGYFRVVEMTAEPQTETTARLVVRGVIQTYQQYADLMVALLRIPGAQTVSREGYVLNDRLVPNLIETDQAGEPIRLTEGRLPTDPFDRLNALIARGASGTTGFTGVGNFGTAPDLPRGAMQEWSEIVVAVQLQTDPTAAPGDAIDLNLLVPNPRATIAAIAAAGGAGAAAAPAMTGAPTTGGPGAPGAPAGITPGAPAGPSTPPPGSPRRGEEE